MKISVITPSVRADALDMVWKCLQKQTFPKDDWEWLVGSPFEYKNADVWVEDPGKNEGDFYSLNKSYNSMLRVAKGDLVISYQDGIWTDPDTLQHFWDLYQDNPMRCVGAVGDQYEKLDEFGKPTVCCWQDPRRTDKYGEYYEINPRDLEWTLASIPKKAIFEAGGFDEDIYDRYAALSEKELNARMDKLGYKFYIDQSFSYKAIFHPRLNGDLWDKKYFEGSIIHKKHLQEIQESRRLKLNYL